MKISVIYNHKDKKHNLFIIMQCKLSKNKGEDFMLKSIRKFFSMILPICMLVTTAPCIISTAEGKTVNFYIMGSIRAEVEGKQVNFFYDDEPSITSSQSGEGNNSPIATLSSDNNNVTFSEDEAGDAAFTATSSDGANFTLKLKVTDDAKKRGWMGTMDPFVRGDWSENPIYGSEKSCDVTKGNENNVFGIALTKGKYIEIEKPSGDFDEKKFSKAISVTDYEGNTFFFGKGSNYTQAVQGEDGAGDGPGGGIKVTVEDEAPFTCVEKICEGTGIDIKVTDSAKSYTLSGTGTCKLRFKDNRKGVWLAGTDGSECGYVEVSTYANDENRANDIIMGKREIVKAGEYYYSDADESAIVHANGDKVAMDKWVKYTIGKNYSTQELGIYEVTVSEIFDETSGSFKVEETEEFVTITLTLNSEAKEKLKKLMNEGGTIKVARNHNGEITFLPDKDVEVDLEKGTITFRAKKFSTYGFYVVSKKDENDVIANNVVSAKNLKTGEDASYLTFLGVLLVTGGWLFILSKKKNKILK